ncbi:UNVERIFIED_CONTAM: hypothetical protein Sangu_3075100, partial [Sesamum angustifolium]
HPIRPCSPKSPIACGSAFESLGGSDGEDNGTDVAKLDSTYLLTKGNVLHEIICFIMFQEHPIRLCSPKSPIACGSAFEGLAGSDDEDNGTDVAKLDSTYLLTKGNVVSGSDAHTI